MNLKKMPRDDVWLDPSQIIGVWGFADRIVFLFRNGTDKDFWLHDTTIDQWIAALCSDGLGTRL